MHNNELEERRDKYEKELAANLNSKLENAADAQEVRDRSAEARREGLGKSLLLSGLFSTKDANPNRSLFRVIDGLDNDMDNEISRRDLKRYLDQYQSRSRYGDVGSGYFSAAIRNYVEELHRSWDSDEIKSLRGTYKDHDHQTRTYDHINIDRVSKMLGLQRREDIYSYFSLEK